jgi:hypothetical protein
MPARRSAAHNEIWARWITPEADAVSRIIDETLREEAWWTAAKSGKFAARNLVWVDRAEERVTRGPMPEFCSCCEEPDEVLEDSSDDLTL